MPGDLGGARVDADQPRRVGAGQPVQDAHPQHRLGLGHVVPEQRDDVGVVDVRVRGGLAVAAEGLLQRLGGGRRAQAGVAVQVVGADAGVGDDRQRVVLLQVELSAGVEAERVRALVGRQLPGAGDDPFHRRVPVAGHQAVAAAYERGGQPVAGVVRLPAEQVLGAKASVVHPVPGSAAHPDDPVAGDRDVQRVPVGVQDGGRRHPPLHGVGRHAGLQVRVDAYRPGAPTVVRRALAPGLGDPVHLGLHVRPPRSAPGSAAFRWRARGAFRARGRGAPRPPLAPRRPLWRTAVDIGRHARPGDGPVPRTAYARSRGHGADR